MKAMSKKLLMALFVLVMVVMLLPGAVFATDNTVVLRPSSEWLQDGARFAAFFIGEDDCEWRDCIQVSENYYEVEVPEGCTVVLFCRMDPDTVENNWDNVWNHTVDLTIPTEPYKFYVIYGWDDGDWNTYTCVLPDPSIHYLCGTMNDWAQDTPMDNYGDGYYGLSMMLDAGVYEYAAVNLHSMDGYYPGTTITVTQYCEVTFFLDTNTGVLYATGEYVEEAEPEIQPDVFYLLGSMNDWAMDIPMEDYGSGYYGISLMLDAGTYDYIAVDEDYNSYSPYATVTVTQYSEVVFVLDANHGAVYAFGEYVVDPGTEFMEYYVTVDGEPYDVSWSPWVNIMSRVEEGQYTMSLYGITPGAYSFQITAGSMGEPVCDELQIEVTERSDITVHFDEADGTATVNVIPAQDNITWKLVDDTLIISGFGPMQDYDTAPWHSLADSIVRVVIEEGVTGIDDYAFMDFYYVSELQIPASVTQVGDEAFGDCSSLRHILYAGTEEQWNQVGFDMYMDSVYACICHYNADGGAYMAQVTEPTCTQDGCTRYVCTLCGWAYEDNLYAPGHTVGDNGKCEVCGAMDDIIVSMSDSGYDGWNGNALEVYVDGELLTTVTTGEGGSYAAIQIPYYPEKSYAFRWVAGLYPWECYYEISLNGEILHSEMFCESYKDGQTVFAFCTHEEAWETIEPSCEAIGGTEVSCTQCGWSYITDQVSALDHSWNADGRCELCGAEGEIQVTMEDTYGDGWNGNALKVYRDGELILTATLTDGAEDTVTLGYYPDSVYTFCWMMSDCQNECGFALIYEDQILFQIENCEAYEDGQLVFALCGHETQQTQVDSTCTTKGGVATSCQECGWTYLEDITEVHGHNFLDYQPYEDATCTKDATLIAHCENCDGVDVVAEPDTAVGHNFGSDGKCEVCGASGDIVLELYDTFGDGWTGNGLEVYENGVLVETVSILDEALSYQARIPYYPGKCYTFRWVKGEWPGECHFRLSLGDEWSFVASYFDCYDFENGQLLCGLHAYEKTVVTATCTEDGYTQFQCACGDSYRENEVQAKGHNYQVVSNNAGGYSTFTCKTCGHSYRESFRFPDVPHSLWSYNAIEFAVSKGYFTGYASGKFGPTDNITRQDFVVVLARIAKVDLSQYTGRTGFPDVKAGDYYEKAVKWASSNGIVNGYNNGNFGVGDKITREQMVTILYNYAKKMGYDVSVPADAAAKLNAYADAHKITGYARPAVIWALYKGVISGMNATTIGPQEYASRGQTATILMNISKKNIMPI